MAKTKLHFELAKTTPPVSLWRRLLQVGLVIVLIVGAYVLYLQFSPQHTALSPAQQQEFLASHQTNGESDKLLIPKIAVSAPIAAGDYRVLDAHMVWHRFPERGNPEVGGNFILAAHRYVFAWLPSQVSERSILYNINQLEVGDNIYVDWHGQRNHYRVVEKRRVEPTETTIEEPSKEAKLTLYSCTLKGQRDGREVIIAQPI